MRLTAAAIVALIGSLGGCAKYEYNIVGPPDLARHIGSGAWEALQREPLEYRLRTVENRLVIHVANPSGDPITLLGDRSYVVAPDGQSHPLITQTIAPGTFVRLIFPPPPAYWERRGPVISFGLGYMHTSAYPYGYRYHGHRYSRYSRYPYPYPGWYPYDYDVPRYNTLYDPNDRIHWQWEGQTSVRAKLVFQRAKETFAHDFVLKRQKM